MKKIMIMALTTVILCAIFINACTRKKESVSIGANLPLTGSMSYYGVEVKRGIEIFEELHNPNILFIFEDNSSDANRSVNIFNKFSLRSDMPVIISCNSPLSMPLRPLAKSNSRVLLALVTGALDFGKENQWSFRDAIRQEPQNSALAEFAYKKMDYSKGATFVVNDDYGVDGATVFSRVFSELGGRIEIQETFTMDQRDMRSSIAKIIRRNVDFVLVIGREASLISAVNQIREVNSEIAILSTNAFESENVYNGIRPLYENIYFTSPVYDLKSEEGMRFAQVFAEKYGSEPSIYAVDAYVASSYLSEIITKAGNNADKIRDHLQDMTYNSEIKGDIYVNEYRDIVAPIGMYQLNQHYKKVLIDKY